MSNKVKYIILAILTLCLLPWSLSASEIAKSKVKGDPDVLWNSPLGSSNIENNAYNRCLLIKKLNPEHGAASTTTANQYDTLTEYITTLYAQSIKISAYIEAEKNTETSKPDLSDKIALIENEVILRLSDIARRVNIINAFESGIAVLRATHDITEMNKNTFKQFKAIKDGEYKNVSDCEVLKE